jgi:hypothetical protein
MNCFRARNEERSKHVEVGPKPKIKMGPDRIVKISRQGQSFSLSLRGPFPGLNCGMRRLQSTKTLKRRI